MKLRILIVLVTIMVIGQRLTANECFVDSTTNTIEGCIIEKLRVFSPSMGREIKAVVVLPPEYTKHSDKKYPVLYAFHGYDAPYTTWSDMSPLRKALATKPILVVSFDADRGSWYLPNPCSPHSSSTNSFPPSTSDTGLTPGSGC